MTVYYRLKGAPGDSGRVTFCNAALTRVNAHCNLNQFFIYTNDDLYGKRYLSTRNVPATLTVLEGPPTRTEPPPAPPPAEIYPGVPSPEVVDFRVRITGGLAQPGDREVPVDVFARAGIEYTGIQIPIDFDERYLRLSRAENRFPAGIVLVDGRNDLPGGGPDEGHVVLASAIRVGTRRLAPAGEEFHAGRLYFDVLPEAAEVERTALSVTPVFRRIDGVPLPRIDPWIGIRVAERVAGSIQEARAEVAPILLSDGALSIRGSPAVRRGDANFDGALDISDAAAILGYLFLGQGEPACPIAADFDRSGTLDITDPIAILSALFLGTPPTAILEPREVPCN